MSQNLYVIPNGERKKLFLTVKCQLTFVEGMIELENHHLVIPYETSIQRVIITDAKTMS